MYRRTEEHVSLYNGATNPPTGTYTLQKSHVVNFRLTSLWYEWRGCYFFIRGEQHYPIVRTKQVEIRDMLVHMSHRRVFRGERLYWRRENVSVFANLWCSCGQEYFPRITICIIFYVTAKVKHIFRFPKWLRVLDKINIGTNVRRFKLPQENPCCIGGVWA